MMTDFIGLNRAQRRFLMAMMRSRRHSLLLHMAPRVHSLALFQGNAQPPRPPVVPVGKFMPHQGLREKQRRAPKYYAPKPGGSYA